MRKYTILLALLICLPTLASAQRIQFGVKGGVTLNTADVDATLLRYDDPKETPYHIKGGAGYLFGLVSQIQLSPVFYFQPELTINSIHYRSNIHIDESIESFSIYTSDEYGNEGSTHFMELPLTFGAAYRFLRFNGGVAFNLFHIGDPGITRPRVGYQAGIGVNLKGWTLDARYHGNFEKRIKNVVSEVGDSYGYSVNDGYFSLSAGYLF